MTMKKRETPRRRKDTLGDIRKQAKRRPGAHNWKPLVERLTDDPVRRAALLHEMESIDEQEELLRLQVIAGSNTAGRAWLQAKAHRAKLLGLYAQPQPPKKEEDAGEVDVVDWAPVIHATPGDAPPSQVGEVRDDIDDALAEAMRESH